MQTRIITEFSEAAAFVGTMTPVPGGVGVEVEKNPLALTAAPERHAESAGRRGIITFHKSYRTDQRREHCI
jgi:hypothetical protein